MLRFSPTAILTVTFALACALLAPAALAHTPFASTTRSVPSTITHAPDGTSTAAKVKLKLARTSRLSVSIVRDGTIMRRLKPVTVRPGLRSIVWDGRLAKGALAMPGDYTVRIALRDPRQARVVSAPVTVAVPSDVQPVVLQWTVIGAVSSPFGPRGGRMHDGIDIPAPPGTAVLAAAAGTVRSTGNVSGYGLTVVIDHADGSSTLYAHLSNMSVTAGAAVTSGQEIGHVGRTGNATTDQVHFEYHDPTGTVLDPVPRLPLQQHA